MTKEQLPGGGTVLGIGRRKTRGQLAKVELHQGIGHLRQAATHAAKGAGATVGPRVQAAREAVAPAAVVARDRASSGLASTVAALAPVALAVRNAQAEAADRAVAGRKIAAAKQAAVSKKIKAKSPKAQKRKRRSRGMLAGLLVAGSVAGVAGAMALRRRREQQEWAEYDPTHGIDTTPGARNVGAAATPGATGVRPTTGVEAARDEVDVLVVQTPSAGGSTPAGSAAPATGVGSSAVAADTSTGKPVIHPNHQVPSVAEGATDVSGRPADDLGKALDAGRSAKSGTRR
ncbi:hypothetical protein [Micromonospora rifamycinica]|uniref:hypothetical protein n=1 Tax=Micromonospora rifamycinica TaxID=291594 RepID=UPI00076C383C|nr:hypothetical protein [Micromonospora rifamycinica]KWV31831.1 hypothetical protein AWV63_15580 [Micromonospora rifamycinica]